MFKIIELITTIIFFSAILLWPRFKYGKNAGADIYFTLLLIKAIKKFGKIPRKIPENILDKGLDYPYFMQYILAKLPDRFIFNYFWIIPSIFNALSIIATYYVLSHIQGQTSAYALVLAFSAPVYICEHNTLTSRVMGVFFCNIAVLSALIYLSTGNLAYLAVMAIFIIFEFYTHKFSSQAILTSVIPIFFSAIFIRDYFLITAILCAFILLAASKTYRMFFFAHLRIIRLWHKEREFLIGNEKNFFTIRFIFDKAVKNLFFNALLFLTLLTPFYPGFISSWSIVEKLSYIILAFTATITLMFTHIPFFSILGEGWRYGAYVVIPLTAILNRFAIFTNAIYLLPIILLLLLFDMAMQKRINFCFNYLIHSGRVVNFLKKLKNRTLCEASGFSTFFAYMTGHKTLTGVDSGSFDELCDLTIFHRKPVEYYLKKYKINTVIVIKGAKTYAKNEKSSDVADTSKPAFKKIFQDRYFTVYDVNIRKLDF
jgi:hypothetical protein